ncbi:hypothetical protein SMIDD28_01387 [Streptococcus mitis]|uniref:Uncharacterized protein n=1 Tax=Streptococcus mitis TaxID=28037 RepID=A0A139Q6U3_STRMT|nr:hypothetical protein SMIDD28_01387 [Streptococcus mitis]
MNNEKEPSVSRLGVVFWDLKFLNTPKIKEQTRKLAAGYSKHCFEVADRADVV